MDKMTKAETAGAARVWWCAFFIYLGFRILGATKKHAWERARLATTEGVIDKVVEWTGISHPSGIKSGHMQVTFEGGPLHRSVTQVEVCGTVELNFEGGCYRYRRTDRKRGDSTIFALEPQG